jgi:hypothetical protein
MFQIWFHWIRSDRIQHFNRIQIRIKNRIQIQGVDDQKLKKKITAEEKI